MKYEFIDIGCGHSDVSVDQYGLDVRGLLVEPIKELCDILPHSDTVLIERSAISHKDGVQDFNLILLDYKLEYYPSHVINDNKLRDKIIKRNGQLSGRSSFLSKDKMERACRLSLKESEKLRVVKVNTLTLESLLNKYKITEVDQFKIDVEGYENVILSQLIKLMRNNKFKVNNKIIFEYNKLSDTNELDILKETIAKEFKFKYYYKNEIWNSDIIMEKI